MAAENISTYAFRLKPGEDLKQGMQAFVKQHDIRAGWVMTAVGSLTSYNIRFANQPQGNSDNGHFEIVSLTGTLSINGSHVHISISDESGKTIGGHLLDGCIVYTTAEIVLAATNRYKFERELDGTTSWPELKVTQPPND